MTNLRLLPIFIMLMAVFIVLVKIRNRLDYIAGVNTLEMCIAAVRGGVAPQHLPEPCNASIRRKPADDRRTI